MYFALLSVHSLVQKVGCTLEITGNVSHVLDSNVVLVGICLIRLSFRDS